MALRPKIVKLIDKYSQKRGTFVLSFSEFSFCNHLSLADLVSMNETFVRARNIFDRMMEESLARHTAGSVLSYDKFPQHLLTPIQSMTNPTAPLHMAKVVPIHEVQLDVVPNTVLHLHHSKALGGIVLARTNSRDIVTLLLRRTHIM